MKNFGVAPTGEMIAGATDIIKDGYDYWRRAAGDQTMPRWCDINPADIAALLPNIVVTHVLENPRDFVERIAGEEVLSHNHRNSMNVRWSQYPGRGPGSDIWQQFSNIVAEHQVSLENVAYVGPHKDFLEVQVLRCPISDDGKTVNKIISFVSYLSRNG
jgi:hypothetical protein